MSKIWPDIKIKSKIKGPQLWSHLPLPKISINQDKPLGQSYAQIRSRVEVEIKNLYSNKDLSFLAMLFEDGHKISALGFATIVQGFTSVMSFYPELGEEGFWKYIFATAEGRGGLFGINESLEKTPDLLANYLYFMPFELAVDQYSEHLSEVNGVTSFIAHWTDEYSGDYCTLCGESSILEVLDDSLKYKTKEVTTNVEIIKKTKRKIELD